MKKLTNIDFQALFESVPGLYLILLPDLTIVAVSDSYLTATLTKRAEILGCGLFDVFPDNPNDLEADGVSNLRASLNSVLLNRTTHTMAVQKYDIRRPDGSFEERFWSPINKPVFNQNQEISYIIHRVEDVTQFVRMKTEQEEQLKIKEQLRERVGEMEIETYKRAQEIQEINQRLLLEINERKKIEKQLEENLVRLENTNKELEAFTYSVSHDLRSPLRSITGYTQILLEDYEKNLDEEGKKTLATIVRNANKMGQLIDDLLAFSNLGRSELMKSKLQMNDLVLTILSDLKEQERNRKMDINLHPLEPSKVDFSMIKQVWINLLSNALKYSRQRENTILEIGSYSNESENVYYIKDNGVGFDMKYSSKLFGVFQRLHKATDFEGTGVGLAIVQRIISRHGGKVWAEGQPNQGATFYFSLPIH